MNRERPTWVQHEREERDETGQQGPVVHRERHPLWRPHGHRGPFEDHVTGRPSSPLVLAHCSRTRDLKSICLSLSLSLSLALSVCLSTRCTPRSRRRRRGRERGLGSRSRSQSRDGKPTCMAWKAEVHEAPGRSDLRERSAGVGAAHYFPRSARTNWKSIRAREAVATAAYRHTPAEGTLEEVLVCCCCCLCCCCCYHCDALLLVCGGSGWWWWWWSNGGGAAALVAIETASTVGMFGRVGGERTKERPGAEERGATKAAAGPTRLTETGRVSCPLLLRMRQLPKSMIAAKFSVSLCRCAARLPRVSSLRCVCAGANEIGGEIRYAPGDPLPATLPPGIIRIFPASWLFPFALFFPTVLLLLLLLSPIV